MAKKRFLILYFRLSIPFFVLVCGRRHHLMLSEGGCLGLLGSPVWVALYLLRGRLSRPFTEAWGLGPEGPSGIWRPGMTHYPNPLSS